MMKLLITGGTGYLGSAIVAQALQQGWNVSATYHTQQPSTQQDVRWYPLDLRQPNAIEQLCVQVQPDVVIHTAFRQNDPDMWQVTAGGSADVAAAAQQVGARLLHLSSDVVFSGTSSVPYTENDPPAPVNAYGRAKADAERLVQAAHSASVIIRTSLIYGFDPIDRHTRFLLAVADGHSAARLFRDEYRCPIFVEDLASALIVLSSGNYCGIIHVAGSQAVSRYEFGCLLAQYYGRDPARIPSALAITHPEPRPLHCILDIQLAQQLLPVPLRGIKQVLSK